MAVKILIPYNFTMNDEKAIEFVGHKYAGEKEAEATLFHAYSPPPAIDTKNNPIMDKMNRNLSYLRQQQTEQKNALDNASNKLMNYGFSSNNIHCIYQPIKRDIAEDIIRLWQEQNFDVVVLNRNPGNIINYFSRSISKRVTQKNELKVHIIN